MSPPTLRQRKKDDTRRMIAGVASKLFAERGFDAVTVNEIAVAAGVAKMTVFNYFPARRSSSSIATKRRKRCSRSSLPAVAQASRSSIS